MTYKKIDFYSPEDYLNVLNHLHPHTAYVTLVDVNHDDEDPVIRFALDHLELVEEKRVNEWLGIRAGGRKRRQYTFRWSNTFLKYLKSYESFFITDAPERDTGFTQVDLSLYNDHREPIFYTITHELLVYMNTKYSG